MLCRTVQTSSSKRVQIRVFEIRWVVQNHIPRAMSVTTGEAVVMNKISLSFSSPRMGHPTDVSSRDNQRFTYLCLLSLLTIRNTLTANRFPALCSQVQHGLTPTGKPFRPSKVGLCSIRMVSFSFESIGSVGCDGNFRWPHHKNHSKCNDAPSLENEQSLLGFAAACDLPLFFLGGRQTWSI